jgi:hypothetical protein
MSGKKVTGRTKQLSLKATAEFHQKLKVLANREKCLMIEILEQALELYEKEEVKKDLEKASSQVSQAEVPEKRSNKRAGQELERDAKKRKVEDLNQEESKSDEMEVD